jgi:hypothetical protein
MVSCDICTLVKLAEIIFSNVYSYWIKIRKTVEDVDTIKTEINNIFHLNIGAIFFWVSIVRKNLFFKIVIIQK